MSQNEEISQPERSSELQLMPGTPGIYEVAGISLQELVNNETALKLLLHTFRQAADENIALKQQQNFDKSEIARIEKEKQKITIDLSKETAEKTIGTVLSFLGTIPVGFGVNILTGSTTNQAAGWLCLLVGICLAVAGLGFTVYRYIGGWFKAND